MTVPVDTPDRLLRYLELGDLLDRYARRGPILELGSGPDGLRCRRRGERVVTVDLHAFPTLDVRADGGSLPFRDQAFTTTICNDVLEHVLPAQRFRLIAELRRVTSDLLIVGGPMGRVAEDTDRRLGRWFARTGRPVPDWLSEHLATRTYPTVEELNAAVGCEPLSAGRGIGRNGHRLLTAAGGIRGGTRLATIVSSTARGRQLLARLSAAGSPYRRVLVYDLAPVRFSVIMATRNRAHRLAAAVAAVLAQSEPDLELLIVNDASDDDTSEVVRRLAAGDARVRGIDVSAPTGSGGLARNIGLRSARGRFLAFCDDDVVWHLDHLARCDRALEQSDACYTQAARFLPDGQFYDVAGKVWENGGPQVGDVDANTIAINRRSMQPFPDGRGRYASEDILLATRLFRDGVRFEHIPAVTVDYTFNPESHCYRYSITEEAGQILVASRPAVNDWRAAKSRLLEAAEIRLSRLPGLRSRRSAKRA